MTININALDGLTLPGGCEHCQAEQKIDANWGGRGIHRIAITHDNWCPRINGSNRAARRAARRHR
ncbi:hypothetical protein ABZ422_09370 [Micromonospora zamorensis]|uniref:hypothetical protein n=1 Tax=Micromonospora zamorensis TaxID=709883 RepID=UPI0033D94C75